METLIWMGLLGICLLAFLGAGVWSLIRKHKRHIR